MNSWTNGQGGLLFRQDYEGYQFPGEKRLLLELIDEGLAIEESRHVNVQDLIGMNSL